MARPWAKGVTSSSQNASPHPPVVFTIHQKTSLVIHCSLPVQTRRNKWPHFVLYTTVFLRHGLHYHPRKTKQQHKNCKHTFANEDVTLDVDDVVFSETVHGNLGFGVAFIVVDERRGNLLLRAPAAKHEKSRRFLVIWPFSHHPSSPSHSSTHTGPSLNSLLPPQSNTNANNLPASIAKHHRASATGNLDQFLLC